MRCSAQIALYFMVAALATSARSETLSDVLDADATLHDVTFVDAQHGWAVGDRGVVLVTDDGGAHWYPQRSGVDCPLLSVTFADPHRGWIVGGSATPINHRTEGVVLRTIDGGTSWQRVRTPTLPRLTYVKFFDAARGVAAGYGSNFYPSGLFASTDGGKSWQPLAPGQARTWLACDFLSPEAGLLAGPQGDRAVLIDHELRPSPMAGTDQRLPRDIAMQSASEGWMVGDDGLLSTTTDAGATWQPPTAEPLPLDRHTRGAWHWNTVAAVGQHVWIAGAPGSVMAHSTDGGQSWTLTPTGVRAPIHQLVFVDAQRGWAVGELGAILTTNDGGRTWKRQRGGGRAAMLALAAAPAKLPLEIATRYAAGEGYRTAALPLFDALPDSTATADLHRASQALAHCGTNYAPPLWPFGTPAVGFHASAEQLMAELDRQTDGLARQQLLAALVLSIRTWQPEVLLVPHPREASRDAASTVIEQLASEAQQLAADPTYAVELAAVGLPAWQVKRTVGLLPPGERGSIRLASDDFIAALGGSPSAWSSPARGLLFTQHTVPPSLHELELISQLDGLPSNNRDLFAGLALAAGPDARRPLVASNPSDLDRLRKLSQKRGQLVRLLDYAEGSPVWSAQVVNLTGGLDAQTGGELLFQLAEGYRETGRQAMAADTLYLLARRYPEHPLAEQALVWLVRYYASGEVAHVASQQQAQAARTRPLANVKYGDNAGAPEEPKVEIPQTSDGGTATLTADERLERATLLGEYMDKARPALFTEPELRFPLVTASRKLGFNNTAERYFAILSRSGVDEGWVSAAKVENWLAKPEQLPPDKPIVTCKDTQDVPHLDGVLDEPLWKSAEVARVGNKALRNDPTAVEVRLARDEQYLYMAISAPRLAEETYETNDARRLRDADLRAFDRVQLRIDMDRDYATAYELTVDCRGWTRDACWGDASWNPRWFVAHKLTDTAWTAEVAVPWTNLAPSGPALLDTWCLGITRQTSHGHTTSWTGTSGDTPESFGLTLFR
ncbi:YCF48-related protein [Aeoliella sp.]|uniref:YCF48-related protein n=1 Tax=Aeoliella sp. TaxID=2795800 RepID=UPI003CCBAC1D